MKDHWQHQQLNWHCLRALVIYLTLIPMYTILILCSPVVLNQRTLCRLVVAGFLHNYFDDGGDATMQTACTATQMLEIVLTTAGSELICFTTKRAPDDPRHFLDIQRILHETGIEHQPGPPMQSWQAFGSLFPKLAALWAAGKMPPKGIFNLVIGNITCLSTHLEQVADYDADALIFQEHSCPVSEWSGKFKHMHGKRKHLILGQLDPEAKHNLGGLGILSSRSHKALKVKPSTKAFNDAVQTGRADHYALDVGAKSTISVFNLYGWTGAHQNTRQAKRTDRLLQAIQDEVHQQPGGPTFIVGDLNGDPSDFKHLVDMLNNDGWLDVGANAHLWGQPQSVPTCTAPNTTTATRRDYVFANPDAVQMIAGFNVQEQVDFPVHKFLRVTLAPSLADQFVNKDIRPANLSRIFNKYCEQHCQTEDTDDQRKEYGDDSSRASTELWTQSSR